MDREKLSRQYSYDVNSSQAEVVALSQRVDNDMASAGVSKHQSKLLSVLVEEIGMHASRRAGSSPFQMEFSILLGDTPEEITMIVRDNGTPYDIFQTAAEGKYNFRDYFIESITVNFPRRSYLASGDENRMILRIGA